MENAVFVFKEKGMRIVCEMIYNTVELRGLVSSCPACYIYFCNQLSH